MYRSIPIAAFLAVVVLQPSFGIPKHADAEPVSVTAEIQLIEGKSLRATHDASKVVVWLVPDQGVAVTSAALPARRHYRMLQHNKTFEPNLLVVPLGSIVDFPNLDPWFHNVFSLYQGKRFDLGLYQAGAEKEVVFDRPGPSFLFCNIHPQMTAVILAVNSQFFGISDKSGRIVIQGVPVGRYAMHFWYENAVSEFTDASVRMVDIGPGETILPTVSIPVTRRDWSHKDKYGNDYDPKASAPAY